MKKTAILLLTLTIGGTAAAEEPKTTPDIMSMYVEMAKPVAGHERLKSLAGRWNIAMKLWFAPDQAPVAARGTATGRMILGNRFLELKAATTGGLASESLSIFGFDRRTSDYTMVGYDTLKSSRRRYMMT